MIQLHDSCWHKPDWPPAFVAPTLPHVHLILLLFPIYNPYNTIIPTLLHWPFQDLEQAFFSSSFLFFHSFNFKKNKNMEVAMELEDDLFFADLSKRISLLIMDDDDEEHPVSTSVSFQDVSRGNYSTASISPLMYEQSSRRESKGTGVFIPRSSLQPRRKHRQGRHNSFNSNSHTHRHQQNSTSVSHQLPFNNSFHPQKD